MSTNFGWNYPPGVTGLEYPIAGPDWEREDGTCPACGEDTLMIQGYRTMVLTFCTGCDFHEEAAPPEPDWDAIYEARKEAAYDD